MLQPLGKAKSSAGHSSASDGSSAFPIWLADENQPRASSRKRKGEKSKKKKEEKARSSANALRGSLCGAKNTSTPPRFASKPFYDLCNVSATRHARRQRSEAKKKKQSRRPGRTQSIYCTLPLPRFDFKYTGSELKDHYDHYRMVLDRSVAPLLEAKRGISI